MVRCTPFPCPSTPQLPPPSSPLPCTQDSLSPLITPRDRCALEYLTDVRYVRGPAGMVVEFHFAPNPYFTNKVGCMLQWLLRY